MKLLVIGGVAAGTKVAAKYKRVMPEAEVPVSNQRQGYFLCRLRPAILHRGSN